MAYTVENFSNDPNAAPGDGGLRLYRDQTGDVTAFNIDFNTISGANIVNSLKELTRLDLTIDSVTYALNIISRKAKPQWYHFTVEPISIPHFTMWNDVNVQLYPSPSDASFSKSDYQAVQNNASKNRSVGFIYDVDRTVNQITPANYQAIMSGSATPAQYQELNYTSIGLRNSRYDGTETSKAEYGIPPAFAAPAFSAAVYSTDVDSGLICSQSIDERVVDEYVFTVNLEATTGYRSNNTLTDTPQLRYRYAGGGTYPTNNIGVSQTSFTVNALVQAEPGDLLAMKSSAASTTTIEIIKVKSISKSPTVSTLIVQRGYKQDIIDNAPQDVGVIPNLHFDKVLGDTVYKVNGNQVYRIANKKVWSKDQNHIFYVDDNGGYLALVQSCGI